MTGFVFMLPVGQRYPHLPIHLKSQLDSITPSHQGYLKYYPCLVRLNDGTALDQVYFGTRVLCGENWGQPHGTALEIRIEDVASLTESPTRLPVEFANQIYEAGESGMGYYVFTVVFTRRFGIFPCRRDFVTGTAVDFIDYPLGRGPADVVAVLPHVGRRGKRYLRGPKYYWCLYSE